MSRIKFRRTILYRIILKILRISIVESITEISEVEVKKAELIKIGLEMFQDGDQYLIVLANALQEHGFNIHTLAIVLEKGESYFEIVSKEDFQNKLHALAAYSVKNNSET